jgi:cytochrome P450 family 135
MEAPDATANLPGPPLPALAQTALYLTRPVEFLLGCRRRYGDTFRIHTVLFGVEVSLTNPEDIRRVFTGDPDVLHAGEANELLEPLLGSRSVLVLDGPAHLRQRRLMMPPFHGERTLAYAATMRDQAEREIAAWPRERSFSLHPCMQRITLEIILRTVFGADGAGSDDLGGALAVLLERISTGFTAVFTLPVFRRQCLGLSPWAAFQRDLARADRLVYRRIAQQRAALARDGDGGGKGRRSDAGPRGDEGRSDQSVLAMLLSARDEAGNPLSDSELRDELMTLLVAGHETTATMLCWALDLILAHPGVHARLMDELRGAPGAEGAPDLAGVQQLPYLDAVLKEVLRLRPVIPAVGRRLTAPMTLRGRTFARGTLLVPVAFLAQRDPRVYPEPEAFRPERFLGAKVDPYAWFPFGGGARRCLGMAFAMLEMKVVLATVLSLAPLRKASARPARVNVRTFTFAPDKGVEVLLDARGTRTRAELDRLAPTAETTLPLDPGEGEGFVTARPSGLCQKSDERRSPRGR